MYTIIIFKKTLRKINMHEIAWKGSVEALLYIRLIKCVITFEYI